VIRIPDVDPFARREKWKVYRTSTAQRVGEFEPLSLMTDRKGVMSLRDAKLVPGTPLALLHWWRNENGRDILHPAYGARFTLIDLEGKPVWTCDRPRDYSIPGNKHAEEWLRGFLDQHGAILRTDQPNRFEIFLGKENKRLIASVNRDDSGKWIVKEVARVPYTEPTPSKVDAPSLPVCKLKYLGPLVLHESDTATPRARGSHHDVLDTVGEVEIVRDRIYATDPHNREVHVFDSSGNRLHVCKTLKGDCKENEFERPIAVNDRDEVFLDTEDEIISSSRRYIRFSPRGERLGIITVDRAHLVYTGNGNSLLVTFSDRVQLRDRHDRLLRTIQRRPDENWLRWPMFAAVAPDGSFALATNRDQDSSRNEPPLPPAVSIYEANGDPVRTVRLPLSVDGYRIEIALDRNWLAVMSDAGLLLFSGRGDLLGKVELPQVRAKEPMPCPYLRQAARELVVFDGWSPILHRYELPPPANPLE
jgi:hypothetical protein